MRIHALSVYAAMGLTISSAAMPTRSPPCHDDSTLPYKALPYLSLPPQKYPTDKPEEKPFSPPLPPLETYLPKGVPEDKHYEAPPTLAPKVESPKPEEKSYLPAPAPKPYPEKPKPEEKLYSVPLPAPAPSQKQKNLKPEEKTYPPAQALKPYLEKPYAASPPPPSSKEEETQSEKPCPHPPALKPYPDRSKADEKPKSGEKLYTTPSPLPLPPPSPALKEGNYKREDKLNSLLPPPPPPYSQLYPEATKSEEKPKPGVMTKPEEPKPDVKSRPQKQPSLEENGKTEKKKRPKGHKIKASDKQTSERLDSLGLSSQADSLGGSNSIELPTDGNCVVNGYAINGDECTTELPYARRAISTVSWRSIADRWT